MGLRRCFRWNFILADVSRPIIGADFLRHYHLLPDLKQRVLVDGKTNLKTVGNIIQDSFAGIKMVSGETVYHKLLKNYPEIFTPNDTFQSSHNTYHHIITRGPPVFCKPRRLDPVKLKAAKDEFQYMLDKGIVRPSSSNWANPLHMVVKPNGEWRPCGDYRALNSNTISDKYPVPYLTDFQMNLHGSVIFSKLDLIKAFYQIPVHPDDIPKTAVITPFGLFEFLRMPFGLCNAAQTFQRFIDGVCRGLDFVFVYIDDVCIFSKSEEEHLSHLKILFERLKKFDIKINPAKCVFGAAEIDFLGHHITSNGISPLAERVKSITEYTRPKSIRDLRRFLAMLNFYRKFLARGAMSQALLNDFLKGTTKKNDNREIPWTEKTITAFNICKQELANAAILSHPVPNAKLALKVDASNFAIGSVLEQLVNESWQPLGFFSKRLNTTQEKYSTYDRELLAIYKSIGYFRHLLEAREFIIYTDHRPLTFAFQQKLEKASPRQINHLDFIAQFSTDIRHLSGAKNVIADALSRIEIIQIQPVDYNKLSQAQIDDPQLKTLMRTQGRIDIVKLSNTDTKVFCDMSTGVPRPYVPKEFREQIFKNLHTLSHPGIRATRKLISSKFFWPSMNQNVNNWSRGCEDCQRSKITRHTKSDLVNFPTVSNRFHMIHIDIVGPLPPSEGFSYLLTCVDRFSRWPEAFPLKDIRTETVFRAFFDGWVSRFGVPNTIVTDRGGQFTSHMFSEITQKLGISHNFTTAYHPQSNGLVERFHRTLKAALTCAGNEQWTVSLSSVLLGLRTSLKEDFGASSAEMIYGETLQLPGMFFKTVDDVDPTSHLATIKKVVSQLKPIEPLDHQSKNKVFFVNKDLNTCTHVWIRRDSYTKPLQPKYSGPFSVLQRNIKTFQVQVHNKKETISIDRLKPAFFVNNDVENDESNTNFVKKTSTTRSGRAVKFPDRFRVH